MSGKFLTLLPQRPPRSAPQWPVTAAEAPSPVALLLSTQQELINLRSLRDFEQHVLDAIVRCSQRVLPAANDREFWDSVVDAAAGAFEPETCLALDLSGCEVRVVASRGPSPTTPSERVAMAALASQLVTQKAPLATPEELVGLCFAVFEPEVERVVLLDRRLPQNHAACLEAAIAVAPWVAGRVEFRIGDLGDAETWLPEGCGLLGIHACGSRTDRVLELGLSHASSLALMPCCYPSPEHAGYPAAIRHRLGSELAADVHRTYRLAGAGWDVKLDAIPPEITPMNRMIIARRPSSAGGEATTAT